MFEFLSALTAPPVLPATIMLGILITWSLLTIVIGGGHHDVVSSWHIHNPFDGVDGHAHGGMFHWLSHSLGDALGTVVLTPVKWLNLKQLPIVLWAGIFTLSWWSISILGWISIDTKMVNQPSAFIVALLLVRNIFLALLITKLITQPMRGWFVTKELDSVSLIGGEGEISSYDATPENGQLKFKTDGAPLLLNVRTDGPHLTKGTRVWITHYDARRRIYIVSATTTPNTQTTGPTTWKS